MIFYSSGFLIFFSIVTLIYFLLPYKYQSLILVIASIVFYISFFPAAYIFLLLIVIAISYFAGIKIEKSKSNKKRKILMISIVLICIVLIIFKYLNFLNLNASLLIKLLGLNYQLQYFNIILPLGLSFYTFRCLSYLIEIFNNRYEVEHSFIIYSLYVMFFPTLMAGPIERPQNLLPQFYKKHVFEYKRMADGIKMIIWGIFKKVVVADRLSLFVNQIYDNPIGYKGITLIVATIFFAFQIYCDFSGYSDMAVGFAKILGFKLTENFRQPYFSKSISEFWERWHISLSTWFRDYIYIPLGGNRVSLLKWCLNIFITFLISGLWHGANWTFVIWGGINGFYIIFEKICQLLKIKIKKQFILTKIITNRYLKIVSTFCLINFGWIFFRSNNIKDSFYIINHLFDGFQNQTFHILDFTYNVAFSKPSFIVGLFSIFVLIAFDLFLKGKHIGQVLEKRSTVVRWAIYYFLILGIIFFGLFSNNKFIYFQF